MSKLLAEWFWTDRWIGSSAFLLPLEARGLYREMLTQAWRRGGRLPDNHEAIRRATGATAEEWDRAWPWVQRYWRADGDGLVNDTQLEVYAEAQAVSQRASTRGKSGAKARSLSTAQAVLEHQPPSLSPSPKKDQEREIHARFDKWWDGYPKKVGKDAAWTEFSRLAPDDHLTDTLIAAVSEQRASAQWLQDNGRYIPHPRTWLHQGRWQDQLDISPPEPLEVQAVDWFDECKQIHGGACGLDRHRHKLRRQIEKSQEVKA
jgi:uncharacterized protein YdaU (DUF1376 family)